MKFSILSIITAAATLSSAQRTFNMSELSPQQFTDYQCLTTDRWVQMVPRCARHCIIQANAKNGCPFDDFACHCANTQRYTEVIEPCILPVEAGGCGGGCTFEELRTLRPIVEPMCNWFNATLYLGYIDCPGRIDLEPIKTLDIISNEATIVEG